MTSEIKFEQIFQLNERVKLKVAPSKIEGVGVHALRDIKKGEKLYLDHLSVMYNVHYSDFNKLNKEVREFILERWPQIVNGSIFAYPDCRYSAFLNHSDTPNVDAFKDVALQDIKRGEELMENYKLVPKWEVAYPWLLAKK